MANRVTFPWRISNRFAVAGAPAVGGGPLLAELSGLQRSSSLAKISTRRT
jgi:hypothetical protein